jgi:hypothetical protein
VHPQSAAICTPCKARNAEMAFFLLSAVEYIFPSIIQMVSRCALLQLRKDVSLT